MPALAWIETASFAVAAPTYNLQCPAGHRSWAPRPDDFAGRLCGATVVRTVKGTPDQRTSCHELLEVVR